MIDPKILCRKHLLGEHGEIHKHRHNFVKRHKMNGRVGQIEPAAMRARHDELADEMLRRGYNHKSPYEMPDTSYLPNMVVDVKESLDLLIERCDDCKKRLEKIVFVYNETRN
jgi:hypothetical protein